MNDWQKVVFHVFGVNLTQKNWALTAIKNIGLAAVKLLLVLAVCVLVGFFFGYGWGFAVIVLAFFYSFYRAQSA